ncbi:hypothetical protein EJ06DRAFT_173458 [Trichodelitschia bisporula]|uniref:F-box domain-containing protein n=1 Tax=Trichodelitschia bisporula TaxID=703511 RepID=A0A6G1HL94_9PEZI|nr:hypothetical protein EJ06DRAFT_173458 [Trichodelitschia bisporula]
MNFLDLHDDVLLHILDHLPKWDLISLVQVHTRLQPLAEKYIWREITLFYRFGQHHPSRIFLRLQTAISILVGRQSLASNVLKLTMDRERDFLNDNSIMPYYNYVPVLKAPKDLDGSTNLECRVPWFCATILLRYPCSDEMKENWGNEVTRGSLDAHLGLLILCCTRLRELSLSYRFARQSFFVPAALSLACAASRLEQNDSRSNPMFGDFQAFTCTVRPHLGGGPFLPEDLLNELGNFPERLLNALGHFPHLSKLDLWLNYRDPGVPQLPPTVRTLVVRLLNNLYYSDERLHKLLCSTPNLTSLTFEDYPQPSTGLADMSSVLRWLQPVRASLQVLNFQGWSRDGQDHSWDVWAYRPLGNGLANFTALHTLKVYLPMLYETIKEPFGLPNLPPNLETLLVPVRHGLPGELGWRAYWFDAIQEEEYRMSLLRFENRDVSLTARMYVFFSELLRLGWTTPAISAPSDHYLSKESFVDYRTHEYAPLLMAKRPRP